jgi:hypothetical protein
MQLLPLVSIVDRRYRRFLFDYLLCPLLQPLRWVFHGMYGVLFGRSDARRSSARARQLEREIRQAFGFLFESGGAAVVPSAGIPFPEPFDYATVTIEAGNLLVRVTRGRDELRVDLARAADPTTWYDLETVLAAVLGTARPQRRWPYDLRKAAALVQQNIVALGEAFGKWDDRVRLRVHEFEERDRLSIREWELRVNDRLP